MIRNRAEAEWFALAEAVDRLERRGRTPPCRTDPTAWFSEKFSDRLDAVEACSRCPVLQVCGAYADAADERFGVWGGTDRSSRPTSKQLKGVSMTRERITAGDYRRAAALLAHYTRNDRAGVNSVIDEAEAAGQMRALVWCVCAVVTGLQDGWEAEAVPEVLAAFAAAFAAREGAEDA